jgi:hypothetical protein
MAVAFQQRSNDSLGVAGWHASKAALTSTSEDSEENLFSLIVSIVAQGKLAGSLIGHNLVKELVAKGSGSHLQ